MEERIDTIYLTETTVTPSYIAYPMFLIDVKISETDNVDCLLRTFKGRC